MDWCSKNFEVLYSELVSTPQESTVAEVEARLVDYFGSLILPEEATVYDHLLLGLREKDVIATFNWDPLLPQAFQRILDRAAVRNLPVPMLTRILFLHGNVAIGLCRHCQCKGFIWQTCSKCGNRLEASRLLYPVQEKSYDADPFIGNEWQELRDALTDAYIITVFGYSAPVSDRSAIDLMRNAWSRNESREIALTEVIDIRPSDELHQSWDYFITGNRYNIANSVYTSQLCWHPRRSCEAFAFASLQQSPWRDNPVTKHACVDDLLEWISPLILEEYAQQYEAEPFSGRPCGELAVKWRRGTPVTDVPVAN